MLFPNGKMSINMLTMDQYSGKIIISTKRQMASKVKQLSESIRTTVKEMKIQC